MEPASFMSWRIETIEREIDIVGQMDREDSADLELGSEYSEAS